MAALIRRRPVQPSARLLPGRHVQTPRQIRALRASAARITPGDRRSTGMVRAVRQPWQERAWNFNDSLGELSYANRYQGNAARRMLVFAGVYMPGQLLPVPVADSDLRQHAAAAEDALDRLGDVGGRGGLLRDNMVNFQVAGECYLIGRTDTGDGLAREVWEVRSVSEVTTAEDGKLVIRDLPGTGGWVNTSSDDAYVLQPEDFACRLWWPSARYKKLADSPLRAAETICEELSILSADIRSAGVSRLVNNGVWLIPDTLTVARAAPNDTDAGDGEDDEFLSQLIAAATEAIADPGSAAAAVPIVARGPAEALKEVRLLTFARPESDNAGKRAETFRRLATALDLPAEVLTGLADLNHWNAWAVSDSTFRSHIEPSIQAMVDGWTAGYFRRHLIESGVPPEAVARMMVWYDPTDLLSKPDKAQDAKDAFNADALSWEALRRHLGFTEDEAPGDEELVTHLLLKTRTMDPGLAVALAKILDPRLEVAEPAPVSVTPAPGTQPQPSAEPPAEGPPPERQPPDPSRPDLSGRHAVADMRHRVALHHQRRRERGAPAELKVRVEELRGRQAADLACREARLANAGGHDTGWATDLSRRLAERDTQLRESLRASAEAAVRRVLERAGARVVSRARQKDRLAADACADMPLWTVPARLGRTVVAALGLSEDALLAGELGDLERTWETAVAAGQRQALALASKLIVTEPAALVERLAEKLRRDRAAGWQLLRSELDKRVRKALAVEPSSVDTAQLVPTSGVRAALAVAGGFLVATSAGINHDTLLPVDPSEHYGQLGTGTTVKNELENGGAKVEQYQWEHGFSINPYLPHAELDGYVFDGWGDPRLQGGDFGGMRPGDHSGCSCDCVLIWSPAPGALEQPPERETVNLA